MTTLTVKLFGPQAQLAKQREVVVEVDTDHPIAADVLDALLAACPQLAKSMATSKLAVNQDIAGELAPVSPGDELALIGMLGGG